jgi:hypothetical protein
MISLETEIRTARAENVRFTDDELIIELEDGRTISVPLGWYPRLFHGTPDERQVWRLIGHGEGIHWEALDEDISTEQVLAGIPSGESQRSLQQWLEARGILEKPVRQVQEKKARYRK